jgi:ribosomal protein L37AE/L43A
MQFYEGMSSKGKCPVCGKTVLKRTTRGIIEYCSRVCASQKRFATRYQGSNSGPLDRPTKLSRTKLP